MTIEAAHEDGKGDYAAEVAALTAAGGDLLKAHGEELRALRDELPCTPDGHEIELSANIELPAEVGHVALEGAQGIGLYRTEFFYLDRPHLPSEEEQLEAYQEVADQMHPKPVILRTMDLGGDKVASYLGVTKEANPFLGWRGIRFALHHPEMFRAADPRHLSSGRSRQSQDDVSPW